MSYSQINADILRTLRMPGRAYWGLLSALTAVVLFGVYCFWIQVQRGMGVAGYEHPVAWGIYITNFVFWVGIAHSGTLISAVLFLFRATWRTAVARAAETMTAFAVITAGLFPIIHIGRPWFFYWLIPYPNERQLWVNFRSPLVWDLFAISTYLTVSLMFLFIGLIPDIAAARDQVKDWRRPTGSWHWAGRAVTASGVTTTVCMVSLPHSRHRWSSLSTASCRGISPWRSSPAGTVPSSPLTLWPARSSRGWRW